MKCLYCDGTKHDPTDPQKPCPVCGGDGDMLTRATWDGLEDDEKQGRLMEALTKVVSMCVPSLDANATISLAYEFHLQAWTAPLPGADAPIQGVMLSFRELSDEAWTSILMPAPLVPALSLYLDLAFASLGNAPHPQGDTSDGDATPTAG